MHKVILTVLTLGLVPNTSAHDAEKIAIPAMPQDVVFEDGVTARKKIEDAKVRAGIAGKNVLILIGTKSCHDTAALLGWFSHPLFAPMISTNFQLVLVESGRKDRNLDLVRSLGFKAIEGTPMLVVMTPDGAILNRKQIFTLRNAASRTPDDLYRYFIPYRSNRTPDFTPQK